MGAVSQIGVMRSLRPVDSHQEVAPPPPNRILIVDDNRAIHEDVRKILNPAGTAVSTADALEAELFDDAPARPAFARFRIDSAFQGTEALAAVKQGMAEGAPYAVAFVDVRMPPGWDGIETISHLWREDPDLQVVICSAYSDHSWSDIMRRLSPTDGLLILRKPFDSVEIRQLAHALTAKWALRRQVRVRLANLEDAVQERTRELVVANQKLQEESAERQTLEASLRLAQKLEAVGQMASGIAHEIGTPVQFISDSVTFLQDAFRRQAALLRLCTRALERVTDTLPAGEAAEVRAEIARAEDTADLLYLQEEVPRAFAHTFDGTARVASIVKAMRQLAHPERGAQAPADINQGIRNMLEITRNEYRYIADTETDLADLPPVVSHMGDLNQVLLNLIVNAAHAIGKVVDETGERGCIRIRSFRDGADVVVSVADNGCGIADDSRDRVFDPFFTTKEMGKGTGQGLAIARSIVVDRHQGTLTFDSEIGRGTTFYMRIPIAGVSAGGNSS